MGTLLELDETQEPIVMYIGTFNILLKQRIPSDLLALYTFYYAKAKWGNDKETVAASEKDIQK